ncbi:hypothetical protein LCGC14_3053660, partial [marine sediment metagenome]
AKMALSVAGLTMGIPISMGANKITGLGNGVNPQDAMVLGQKYTNGDARTATLEATDYPTGWDGDDNHAPTQDALFDLIDGKIFKKDSTFPVSPIEGQLYYDTVDEAMYRRSGDAQAWIQIGASGIGGNVYLEIGIASDDLAFSNDTERGVFSATYAKIKEITVLKTLSIRVYWEHRSWAVPGETKTRVYINGVATGSEHTATTTSYVAFTEDVEVNKGDLLQIYGHYVNVLTTQVRNMRIKYSEFESNDP